MLHISRGREDPKSFNLEFLLGQQLYKYIYDPLIKTIVIITLGITA